MAHVQPAKTAGMEEMASAMTAMANMCREMIQRETAMRPYKMVAAVSLGGLLVIALILFVVLIWTSQVNCTVVADDRSVPGRPWTRRRG